MNSLPASPPSTDPDLLLQYRDRQYAAELMAAAVLHLDLFTWLDSRGSVRTGEIRQHFGLAERPLDVLLTLSRAMGILSTEADGGTHRLTRLSREHLTAGSPWFLGPYYGPVRDTPVTLSFLEVLRTGRPCRPQTETGGRDWHESMLDPEFARDFTALMNCRGLAFGQVLARALAPQLGPAPRLLDVGGGSGIYASTLAAAIPDLTGTVLEQAPVDAITRSEIARHGLTDRLQVLSGDMFSAPWPEAEVLLFSNLLHDWDFPEVRRLVAKAAAALTPGGLLVIHEVFIADDKTGPLPAAEYSALLMNITRGKCYTAAEYADILTAYRLVPGPYAATTGGRGFMTARKP